MKNDEPIDEKKQVEESPKSVLEQIIHEGARRLLQAAIENEVAEYVERFKEMKNEKGHRMVVKNGSSPERTLVTGVGPLTIRQPRIHDRREGESFTSAILPRYMRKVPTIDKLLPVLYLKGISTGDMASALESILGPDAPGLSANNIVRLKRVWETEYKDWAKRDLTGKHYVYFWVDGIHFNVRLEEPDTNRMCFLVVIGALENGKKELVAILDGYRESKSSWLEVLFNLKQRGLAEGPRLAIGDGSLGFWAALPEVYPETREQRAGSTRPRTSWIRCREACNRRPKRKSTTCTWHRQKNRHSLRSTRFFLCIARSSRRPVSASPRIGTCSSRSMIFPPSTGST